MKDLLLILLGIIVMVNGANGVIASQRVTPTPIEPAQPPFCLTREPVPPGELD